MLDDPATAERGPAARELERSAPVFPLQELRATRRQDDLITGRRRCPSFRPPHSLGRVLAGVAQGLQVRG